MSRLAHIGPESSGSPRARVPDLLMRVLSMYSSIVFLSDPESSGLALAPSRFLREGLTSSVSR